MYIDFPVFIDVCDSTIDVSVALSSHLKNHLDSYIVVSGSTKSASYAESLLNRIDCSPLLNLKIESNTVSDVYDTERYLRDYSPTLVVGIGGGKVGDFCKRLTYLTNTSLLLIPTIIANDGLISPIAVLQDEGYSVSLPGRMPDAVLIDMQVISKLSQTYLRAAACDLITNLSATNDWVCEVSGETLKNHHLSVQMSRMAAHMILNSRDWSVSSILFIKSILYGQMLSGIAMTLSGSSRPCSGSEHLIAHALDAKLLGMNVLHGEKVGIISRFCLFLQNAEDPILEEFFQEFGVPKEFPGCETYNESDMINIFSLARKMRPGRKTTLDFFSDSELAEKYIYFKNRI